MRWLRMSVMAPATDEETIDGLLEAIERLAPGLEGILHHPARKS